MALKFVKVPPPLQSEAIPADSDSQPHQEISFLQIVLKGAAAQNQETLQKILAQMNQQSGGQTPETVEGPEKWGSTTDQMRSVADRFVHRIAESAYAGNPGQLGAMKWWVTRDHGVSKMSDLVAASGVASNHAYAGIAGGLQKNMRKVGGPQKVAIGLPVWPENWYGWEKLDNGDYLCTIHKEFVKYLKRALAEHFANLPSNDQSDEGPGPEQLADPN
jgi:hypothetical protein